MTIGPEAMERAVRQVSREVDTVRQQTAPKVRKLIILFNQLSDQMAGLTRRVEELERGWRVVPVEQIRDADPVLELPAEVGEPPQQESSEAGWIEGVRQEAQITEAVASAELAAVDSPPQDSEELELQEWIADEVVASEEDGDIIPEDIEDPRAARD